MNRVYEFGNKRLELIQRLEVGELDKETFILENYRLIGSYTPQNFNVNSVEEGVVKYHYFNTKAKKLMLEADELEFRDPRMSDRLKNNAYDFYVKKDKITLAMLEHVNFEGVTAYFINMNSKYLEGSIYEICFKEHDKVILHSRDRRILYKLKCAGCYDEETRDSVIGDYVNTKI